MSPIMSIVVGATLLTVITIAYGGTFVLRATTGGYSFNPLQKTFFRAGHAHAGVLVILGIVCAFAQASAGVTGGWEWAAVGVLASAILVPAGFFLMALLWAGVVVLAFSLAVVGASVIAAGISALG